MGLGYDDMVRYADASLAAHQRRVAELAEQSTDGSWGDAAMRHRLRLESWRSAQRSGVHRWAIAKGTGAVCTCGLIAGDDPLRSGSWRRFFGWLGHLDSATDGVTASWATTMTMVVRDGAADVTMNLSGTLKIDVPRSHLLELTMHGPFTGSAQGAPRGTVSMKTVNRY